MNAKKKVVGANSPLEDRLTMAESLVLKDDPKIAHPTVYVDQLSALAIGPFITKFTLALESHATSSRTPVITIAMPSNMTFIMAKTLVDALRKMDDSGSATATVNQFLKDISFPSEDKPVL